MEQMQDNFIERTSAIGFPDYEGTLEDRTNAGGVYDESAEKKAQEAYKIIDNGYAAVRSGVFEPQSLTTRIYS